MPEHEQSNKNYLLLESYTVPVQGYFAGQLIVDSPQSCLLREINHTPVLYFPWCYINVEFLMPSDTTSRCPYKGDARYWHLEVNGILVEDALWSYPEPVAHCPDISQLAAFYRDKLEIWVGYEIT